MVSSYGKDLSKTDKAMSDVVYAKTLFSEAFPVRRYGSVKAMLYAAHRYMSKRTDKNFTERRARSIWEGTARRIDGEEIDALRAALIEESIREQRELRARLAALDAKIAVFDQAGDFGALARAGASESRLGRMDTAGGEG